MSQRLITPPYSISRATPTDVDCGVLPTSSVPSNKADNHAPISFDQQAPSFSDHLMQKNKENCGTEVRGG